ncbi:MAG: hypothetical protein MUE84_17740 [Hyphomonas sp.]|nr:hypothetical protein [Hyphomonas sp.]
MKHLVRMTGFAVIALCGFAPNSGDAAEYRVTRFDRGRYLAPNAANCFAFAKL